MIQETYIWQMYILDICSGYSFFDLFFTSIIKEKSFDGLKVVDVLFIFWKKQSKRLFFSLSCFDEKYSKVLILVLVLLTLERLA